MHANANARTQQQHRVRAHARKSDAVEFFNLLTRDDILGQVETLLPEHRERLFPPTETLSMFLAQALSADRSCQKVVNESAVQRIVGGLPRCSSHTGGYCRARQRLPVNLVSTLTHHTGQLISARASVSWCWEGRPVRLVDGTTVTMPDTVANQAEYPQSRSQKPELGFPILRMVGIVCLGSGAVDRKSVV